MIVSFINSFIIGVRRIDMISFHKPARKLQHIDSLDPRRDNERVSDRPDLLGVAHCLDRSSCHVRQHLAGNRGQGAAADKSDRIGCFDLPRFAFQQPSEMKADPLQNGADHISFAVFDSNVEEHSARMGVLKRAAVTMEPRGKEYAVCSRRDFADLI